MSYKKSQPDWLEKLHHNSWQIELLIAGGIVYTLYQLPSTFRRYLIFAYETNELNDTTIITLVSAYLMTRLLLIGFSVNLVLRAIWVAYIGIHATFPQGINRYHHHLGEWINHKYPNQLNSQERLDKFEAACNLSYSLAILLCLMSISVILSIFVIFNILEELPYSPIIDSTVSRYTIIGIVVYFILGNGDAFIYRFTKHLPRVQAFFDGLIKVLGILTLSFLYKKEWLVLTTNIKAWRIQLLMGVYFALGLFISINQIGDYLNLDGFFHVDPMERRDYLDIPTQYTVPFNQYYNRLPEKKSFTLQGCISEDIVKDRFMWIFICYWEDMDESFEYFYKKNNAIVDWADIDNQRDRVLADSLQRVTYSEMFSVYIDKQPVDSLSWYEHSLTKTGEKGFIAYVDTEKLQAGEHKIIVQAKKMNWRGQAYEQILLRLPFWKE